MYIPRTLDCMHDHFHSVIIVCQCITSVGILFPSYIYRWAAEAIFGVHGFVCAHKPACLPTCPHVSVLVGAMLDLLENDTRLSLNKCTNMLIYVCAVPHQDYTDGTSE